MGYIFWCVDTQKDLLEGSYKIPNAKSILKNLNDLTQIAKLNNIKVINSLGWYKPDSTFLSNTPDYDKTFPPHCLMNTEGANFINETTPENMFIIEWDGDSIFFPDLHKHRNIVVKKKSIDIFEGNSISESLLHNLGIPFMERPKFIVYGFNIKPVVISLLKRGYEVIVVLDGNMGLNGQPFGESDANNLFGNFENNKINNLNFTTTEIMLNNK